MPGCITVLHRYHAGHRCYVHEARQPVKFSGAMDNRLDVISAQELFSEVA